MAKRIFNLYEAKTSLSSLVNRAARGEDIIIAKAGVPKAKLVAISDSGRRRKPGGWEGRVRIARNFDAPLPEEILAAFGVDAQDGE